ncbi:aldehyde dehydrogenase family protein [Rhodospirillaceae bacterium KN72]|uniref:Aldehyde dehydrogenase family protein n=1 Tax=Pacificispira spongiicola TaxID=2729598 RepID=A0A7Y0DWI0_9PROT|nr:aldehyde dehydrogenase family protein [Pacificispira spongiicola]NMM42899.1 aldehyde dehydrogenase family protein [Pacificispira spongiicola]
MGEIVVTAPYDGAEIGTVPTTDQAGIEAALDAAYGIYRNRASWIPKARRITILRRTAELIRERRQALAVAAAREGGKPLRDSLVEIDRAADGVDTCIEQLRNEAGSVIPMRVNPASSGRIAFTQYEPIGVVVAVSAFNHPFNLIVHQVAPAIATGCPVIVKPAATTPLSCRAFLDILYEAGLPESYARMVMPETHEQATAMVADPRVGFFSFIGSSRVGWMLRSKLAPGARCALEHGGVAPVIVASDADLDSALPRLAKGGFYHAGQVCVSVQRIFCERSIAQSVAEGLVQQARIMTVGDPTESDTDIGPLITHAECDRIDSWVEEARASGASILSGGGKLSSSCYKPTIIYDPEPGATVSTQEVFGPVICVYPVDNLDEGIERANSLPVSFQASVFTRDLDTAMRCYRHLDGTAVMVNDHTAFRVDWMPFAGARTSGHGVGGIPYTMHEMQTEKMMVWRSDVLN